MCGNARYHIGTTVAVCVCVLYYIYLISSFIVRLFLSACDRALRACALKGNIKCKYSKYIVYNKMWYTTYNINLANTMRQHTILFATCQRLGCACQHVVFIDIHTQPSDHHHHQREPHNGPPQETVCKINAHAPRTMFVSAKRASTGSFSFQKCCAYLVCTYSLHRLWI